MGNKSLEEGTEAEKAPKEKKTEEAEVNVTVKTPKKKKNKSLEEGTEAEKAPKEKTEEAEVNVVVKTPKKKKNKSLEEGTKSTKLSGKDDDKLAEESEVPKISKSLKKKKAESGKVLKAPEDSQKPSDIKGLAENAAVVEDTNKSAVV